MLANNAGGVFGRAETTADGFDRTMQVNHVAPFLLTHLLLPRLVASRASIVQTSSVASRLYGRLGDDVLDDAGTRSAEQAYGDAKLANILFTREAHRRWSPLGISTAAFHPGFIASGFAGATSSRAMRLVYANPLVRPFLRSPEQGAADLVRLATTRPGVDWTPGVYLERHRPARRPNPQALDADLARRLWDTTAARLGLASPVAPAAAGEA